jgi:hypothetical protein
MMKTLTRASVLWFCATACAFGPVARGAIQAGHPGKEEAYTITSVMQVLKPVDPAVMNDDFQDTRLVARDDDSCTLEITYYPLHEPSIGENPNWQRDYAGMTNYLRPMPGANWDEAMRKDLLAELSQAGIDPDRLSDRQLVERVSKWAMNRAQSTRAFAIWDVYYPEGKPAVFPELRAAFDGQKPDKTWTDQQMFAQEVLGKEMFYGRTHGSCTSCAVYLATVLRALGIPTRIVFCIPPFDPNDSGQAQMFYEAVHHHQVRETVRAALGGLKGFCNHLFNEVNYSTLGQSVLDAHYFGLLTHIYTCADLSQLPLAQTWGTRYSLYPAGQPKLSSVNPYRLLAVQDHFGTNAAISNPEVPVAELRTVTISGLYWKGSVGVPSWVATEWAKAKIADFLIAIRERVDGPGKPMRAFEERAGHEFLLTSPPHPAMRAHLNGLTLSDANFWAFGVKIAPDDRGKLVANAAYAIEPKNTSETYRWVVAPSVTLKVPATEGGASEPGDQTGQRDWGSTIGTKRFPEGLWELVLGQRALSVEQLPDGRFKAEVVIHNIGTGPSPEFPVWFYAGEPEKGGKLLVEQLPAQPGQDRGAVIPAKHTAGPIAANGFFREVTFPFELKAGETAFAVIDPENTLNSPEKQKLKSWRRVR